MPHVHLLHIIFGLPKTLISYSISNLPSSKILGSIESVLNDHKSIRKIAG